MEAGQPAGLVDEIERRKIHRRQEPQPRQSAQIRLGDALARIKQQRQVAGAFGCPQRDAGNSKLKHAKRENPVKI